MTGSQLSHPEGLVFGSGAFFVFFVLVFTLYWALPRERLRTGLLLAASLFFYATWSRQLALIVLGSATLDFFLARAIEKRHGRPRRLLLLLSISANLGLLGYFKYVNFFLASLEACLHRLGLTTAFRPLSVLVPLGISFYTFEAISYVVDVHQGLLRAERRLTHFLLFILFFPHLMAGPIVRGRDFLPQVGRRKRWSWLRLQLGARLFLLGFFKKWVVADRMVPFVDPVFADPGAFRAGVVWVAVLAYALQIYCDFSGYTDMAIGIAHLLGYKLARNFDLPYLSASVGAFWRRWHISLSSWLRDYLFIPLGGSRCGRARTSLNLLAVMTLGGLWHGARWTFVAWGVLHGLFLVAHHLFRDFCERRPAWQDRLRSVPGAVARVTLTLACVCLGWIFFRAPTFAIAAAVLRRLFSLAPGRGSPLPVMGFVVVVMVVVVGHVLGRERRWSLLVDRLPGTVLGLGYALLLTACLTLVPPGNQPFIYFHF